MDDDSWARTAGGRDKRDAAKARRGRVYSAKHVRVAAALAAAAAQRVNLKI
jgi:hypothetical protein